jgi:hypothetical protein
MRGADGYSENLLTTVGMEDFVPSSHPLRLIRVWVNEALTQMDGPFSAMYEADVCGGRPTQHGAGEVDAVDQVLTLTMAAYNLTRLRSLAMLRPQAMP